MKFVQLLRPLFFVALGLHALALFLPYGEAETAVVEDVELSEVAKSSSAAPSGTLPVPDPNVTTGTKPQPSAPGALTPTAKAAASVVASRRPAAPASTAAADSRRAAANRQGASSSATTGSASSPGNDSAASGTRTRSQAEQSTAEDSNQTNSANDSDSGLAVFEPPIEDPGADATDANDASDSNAAVSALLAKVTRELPNSLRDFAAKIDQSLTYNAENTDDASAQQAKDEWQSDMQQQANVGPIEPMPPAQIAELTQIEYPIESSLKSAGRSLRRCLTEDPKTAEVGVRFDARGNVADEPRLLRSTGYSALNEEIKAMVAAYDDFPSDRASKAYTFEVEVFYDNELCITAEGLQK